MRVNMYWPWPWKTTAWSGTANGRDVSRFRAQALYVVRSHLLRSSRHAFETCISSARLPTIHELGRWPEAGALISYGPDLQDLFRRAASYVDRILRGANPAELPVEQPTRFDLVLESQDCKVARPGCATATARPIRRGHRMNGRVGCARAGRPHPLLLGTVSPLRLFEAGPECSRADTS